MIIPSTVNELLALNFFNPFNFFFHVGQDQTYYIEIKPFFRMSLFLRKSSFQKNSHWRCSVRKGGFIILQISQQNTCVGVSFNKVTGLKAYNSFNKVTGLKAYNFIKKTLRHKCFPVKFAKFSRATISKNICERLILSSLPV